MLRVDTERPRPSLNLAALPECEMPVKVVPSLLISLLQVPTRVLVGAGWAVGQRISEADSLAGATHREFEFETL